MHRMASQHLFFQAGLFCACIQTAEKFKFMFGAWMLLDQQALGHPLGHLHLGGGLL